MQYSQPISSDNLSRNNQTNLLILSDWQIKSSMDVNEDGKEISLTTYESQNWYNAHVPCTVLGTLVKTGVYQDPLQGMNLKNISSNPFEKSWWFRTKFELEEDQVNKNIILSFDGINYRADMWLNGKLIANSDNIEGPFRRFKFSISGEVISGKNVLAVQVYPPQTGQLSIGFVDWNPAPPDRNMGIFRPVKLHLVDKVSIENPFIQSEIDSDSFNFADLIINAEVVNYSNQRINGILRGNTEDIQFEQKVSLSPGERKHVEFNSKIFPQLKITDPRLWWPNNLGDPDLYELYLEFSIGVMVTDTLTQSFGIRLIEDYLNDNGHRGFKINGKKLLIKGAGWTDDIFLNDTPQSLETQIHYVRHMNLNCIRLEGLWGKDQKLYDLCDQLGILIMAGWSCHWEHEIHLGKPVDPRYGGITEPDDINLIAQSWEDQVIWLRNHPSIFVWSVGSDMVPHPDLERRYFDTFKKYDPTRPYLNSTGGIGSDQGIITQTEVISDISGSSGVKMLGPYDYTPPVYWYTNKHLGGAYGFNTETCPGANVPPLESIKKMIPEEHLWPIDDVWNYHCALYEFSKLDLYREAIDKRYGSPENLIDFARKSQVLNYELMRPMFEAFQVNKGMATGIIQWMLNSAWPSMYWQLYDYYLMPNGAFYATKKACEPLHLLYNYGNNSIHIINDLFYEFNNYKAFIRIFNINSQQVFQKEIPVDIPAESSVSILSLPEINFLSTTYFLDLRLIDAEGKEICNNFYWLSLKSDVLDYDFNFDDFAYHTPSKEFADFTQLESLPLVSLDIEHQFENKNGKQTGSVTIKNPSEHIAFFLDIVLTGKSAGNRILPVFLEDNYFSLLPGETRNINMEFNVEDLKGDMPDLKISGWNI